MPEKFVVKDPVIDLRREPSYHSGKYEKDALQETQLLLDEPLLVHEEKGGWVRVEAPEQACFKSEWCGYPGWVRASQISRVDRFQDKALIVSVNRGELYIQPAKKSSLICSLSLGTKLTMSGELSDWWEVHLGDGRKGFIEKKGVQVITEIHSRSLEARRGDLVELGKRMLGAPYLWGGRSSYQCCHQTITSVDCSGFSSLLYRVAHGIDIPRDAHDQFLKCRPCEPKDLKEGDLIFLASQTKPDRMNHVMLYAGEDQLLEATEQTRSVQISTFKKKLGVSLDRLYHGACTEKYLVFFGYNY